MPRRHLAAVLLGLGLVGPALCPAAAQDDAAEAVPEDLAFAVELAASWETAWNAGDLDALVALYAEDAQLYFDEVPRVEGRAGIRTAWESDIANGGGIATYLTVESAAGGMDVQIIEGTYMIGDSAGAATGRFLQIWTFGAAGWHIDREAWIPDVFTPYILDLP